MMNCLQPDDILQKADEILINKHNNYSKIQELITKYPNKKFSIAINGTEHEDINWKYYEELNQKYNIIFRLRVPQFSIVFVEHNIKWYWEYEASNWYELHNLITSGASEIIVSDDVFFNIENLKYYKDTCNVKFRMIPNTADNGVMPKSNGIYGSWVRPEDIYLYEDVIDTVEFRGLTNLEDERTIFHIYAENKSWPGNLNLLIKNLNFNVDNRGIPDEFGVTRLNCNHKCCSNSTCHYCTMELALTAALDKHKEELINER